MRKTISFRFAPVDIDLLALVARRLGITKTAVLTMALRDLARREGILNRREAGDGR